MKKRIISLVLALVMCVGLVIPAWAVVTEQNRIDSTQTEVDHVLWIEHDGATGTTKIIGEYCSDDDDYNDELVSPPYNPEETRGTSNGSISPMALNGGEDDITATTTFPYSAVVYIVSKFKLDGMVYTKKATGVMVGQSEVLTSGHVVYDKSYGGYATSFSITPGGLYSGRPTYTTSHAKACSNWISSPNSSTNFMNDYALICLDDKPDVGFYGLLKPSNSTLNEVAAYGFPGNKTEGTMWSTSGSVYTQSSGSFAFYGSATYGYSGGPIVLTNNNQYNNQYMVGIVCGGDVTVNGDDYVFCTRMSNALYNFIMKNADRSR